jgi:hypothetical protein
MLLSPLVRVWKDRCVSRSPLFGLLKSPRHRVCSVLVQSLRWMTCIEGLLGRVLTRVVTAMFQVYFGSPLPYLANTKIEF